MSQECARGGSSRRGSRTVARLRAHARSFDGERAFADRERSLARWVLCAVACGAVLVAQAGCARQHAPRTRIVLVTLDTLRYDRFEGPGAKMPATHRVAERGARFESCYSATSTTQPTHATIFTGLQPWQHGVTYNGAVLDAKLDTLAERLRTAGFETAAVVASFPLHRRFGFDQGFTKYVDDFTYERPSKEWSGVKVDEDEFYSLADSVATSAVREIDEASGDRQFFWFHFYDAHAPYGDTTAEKIELGELTAAARQRSPQLEAMLERARSLYDADVESLDRALERVLARITRDEATYETHLFVTADHGECFGEDGSLGHGKRLSRAEVHVPLFIVSPRVAPGVRTDTAGSIDVYETIANIAGLSGAPPGTRRDLTARDTSHATATVGMRRTYAKPFNDVRITGEVVPIQAPIFYVVKDDSLYVGDESKIESEAPAPDREFIERARKLFAVFRGELEGTRVHEDLDPDTQRVLEGLGYTR